MKVTILISLTFVRCLLHCCGGILMAHLMLVYLELDCSSYDTTVVHCFV
jgi:hypothetical protein